MFKDRKIELRLKKDRGDGEVEQTPSITKEDVLHIAKKVTRHIVGGILVILTYRAVLDTATFGAMTAIENKSQTKDED